MDSMELNALNWRKHKSSKKRTNHNQRIEKQTNNNDFVVEQMQQNPKKLLFLIEMKENWKNSDEDISTFHFTQ